MINWTLLLGVLVGTILGHLGLAIIIYIIERIENK